MKNKTALLFCCSPLDRNSPDEMFADEYLTAQKAGFDTFLFDETVLSNGQIEKSVRHLIPAAAPTPLIYRGWMLSAASYQALAAVLSERHFSLINSPTEYLTAHYLPLAYPLIKQVTSQTIWFAPETALSEITARLAQEFGDQPLVLKDYVKSQKHYWQEACFIPAANDAAAVTRVTKRFLELQEDNLVGGLVYRRFIPFELQGQHPQSKMPVAKELRAFVYKNDLLAVYQYWEGFKFRYSNYEVEKLVREIVATFPSNFYTIDLALQKDKQWLVVEVGDGQVSSIPTGDYLDFYQRLAEIAP